MRENTLIICAGGRAPVPYHKAIRDKSSHLGYRALCGAQVLTTAPEPFEADVTCLRCNGILEKKMMKRNKCDGCKKMIQALTYTITRRHNRFLSACAKMNQKANLYHKDCAHNEAVRRNIANMELEERRERNARRRKHGNL